MLAQCVCVCVLVGVHVCSACVRACELARRACACVKQHVCVSVSVRHGGCVRVRVRVPSRRLRALMRARKRKPARVRQHVSTCARTSGCSRACERACVRAGVRT
jgi:hypothetical protein